MSLTKEEIHMMLYHLNDEQIIKVYNYILLLQREKHAASSMKADHQQRSPKQ
ncbi:hypothetical protein [Alkalihalophilus marmarensis]|uniref:hypothetical protein n=1 Tax=Alkalihalophilus marmarensis TaxID=521377 RepID=UPI002DB5CE66|nr:hypothetical protein [Alkalihalophilus marmarensis]MEC2072201.1 hypothetical protein [Alkalihalophilus marmarensis]